jgi:glycosyltransferase involved in cell wall biosynthesis
MKTVAHLTSSRFFGGPERQMLGLAEHLEGWRTIFASFSEQGHCRAFLGAAGERGFEARALAHDTPKLLAATAEVRRLLVAESVEVLLCHGYKADLIGRRAARSLGVPVIGVSRGWTAESFKVRLYEALDRRVLRGMDTVVCVSEAQAARVRRAGVPAGRVVVIRNSIAMDRFGNRDAARQKALRGMFRNPPKLVVAAAGRLSPEKGFEVLVRAAESVVAVNDEIGFLVFGEGPERQALERQIAAAGLQERFVLAGFCGELDAFFPAFDILALPSFTEGLPNVVLEAFAAGVPVVATAVGGVPEVLENGRSGLLVAAGDHAGFAKAVLEMADDEERRCAMAAHGQRRVERAFSFAAQASAYERLFAALSSGSRDQGLRAGASPRLAEVAGTHV